MTWKCNCGTWSTGNGKGLPLHYRYPCPEKTKEESDYEKLVELGKSDFTPGEIRAWEARFDRPISSIQDDFSVGWMERVGYLGWMKYRRIHSGVSFDDYMDGLESSDELQLHAFGMVPDE